MKKIVVLFVMALTIFAKSAFSQNCFEITSILVDACGNPEGENEMVQFKIGPADLLTSNLSVDWPSNNFIGVCQNANTSQKISDLNATITSCGILVEPVADILPANSTVILVTSENMNTTFNSFANLTDTIYMIFQCQGNTQGHFKNHYPISGTSGNPRILSLSFGPSCVDTVAFIPNFLVNEFGTYDTLAQDGSSVAFDAAGNPTYYNNGCQAPIITLNATETISADTTCPGSLLTLTASNLSGNYSSYFWEGGNGTITAPTVLTSTYQTDAAFTGTDYITFAMIGQCNDTIRDSIAVFLQSGSAVNISGPTAVCTGDTIVLTASSNSSYLWSGGQTSQSINVTTAGTYTVTASGSCGTSSYSVTITGGTAPNISVTPGTSVSICSGQSVTLTATGASSYTWSTGATTSFVSVSAAGVYTVSSSTSCGVDSVQITVAQSTSATVNITSSNGTSLCPGASTVLTANSASATGYSWSGGQTSSTINVTAPGSYTVTVSSSCGTATATQVIAPGTVPNAIITSPSTVICPTATLTLTASGGNAYLWNTGAVTPTLVITQPGSYKALVSNGCGNDSAIIVISASTLNAAFTPNLVSGNAPLAVNFANGSTSNVTNFWSFGDGGTANSVDADNVFNAAGIYTVVLTVTDNGNCTDTASTSIEVLEDTAGIFIPDVFTPNGDGTNDYFEVIGSSIRYTDVTIYNRWGQFITKYSRYAKGTENGWDGSDANEGVYYYIIEIGFKDRTSRTVKGYFSLVR